MFYLLIIGVAILSFAVQSSLGSKMKRYQRVIVGNGNLTGAQIAEQMLRAHGITDVRVSCVNGFLSDHYNPMTKTVNLSEEVYRGNNITAAAVAAHECGHAVQHATAYSMLKLRSALVPVTNLSAKIAPWLLMGGVLLLSLSSLGIGLLLLGIILFSVSTIFSLVTLPVEIDASRRAIQWLQSTGITYGQQTEQCKDALKSAAYTYVVAAIGSIANLLYYILIFVGASRRD